MNLLERLNNPHSFRVLEFDRVRGIVASFSDSAEGRAALAAVEPLADPEHITALLAETSELMNAVRFDDPLPGLTVHDIRDVFPLLKIEGYRLEIEAIAAVAGNCAIAREVREWFDDRIEKYPLTSGIGRTLVPHRVIEDRVRKAIAPDLTVADDATPELRSIRRRLESARASLRSLVEHTLDSLSDDIVGERTVTLRNGRYVIPVRDAMRNKVPGAIHDRSQTGRTLFIEPLASIEGNNTIRELEIAEQEEIDRILRALSALIAEAADDIRSNQAVLVRLDIILAKARYGARSDGTIPRILDTPEMSIVKARHPLLDWKFRVRADGSKVVPMDVAIGGETVTIVLTGPNAGGKTVVLKTIGLVVLMALSGFPVPAGEGTAVCVPDGIFADIGDEQSIEDDLSTFSSHMKQIVAIIRGAGRGSLVLLDELGGGTNPADGEAIALAVLAKLTGMSALTVATTHHGGLKVFAHETPGVINASMEFDNANLRPTFVLKTGVPGSSYAFEIASRMGMPPDVLAHAEAAAGGERKSLESLIAEMEEQLRLASEERRSAEYSRIRMETEKRKYEEKLADFAAKRNDLMSAAVADSERIMENANRSIENAVRLIKEGTASKESIREAKELVAAVAGEIKKKAEEYPSGKAPDRTPPGELSPGLRVRVPSMGADAVVEQVLDDGRKARILIGKSKASLVVGVMDLARAEPLAGPVSQVVRVNAPSGAAESNEIDVRGLTFDEAREEVELFLDRLRMTGMDTAHIIHGKGTGALRNKLGPWLDSHPYVESRRLGNWNEGSYGVTVVTLRT